MSDANLGTPGSNDSAEGGGTPEVLGEQDHSAAEQHAAPPSPAAAPAPASPPPHPYAQPTPPPPGVNVTMVTPMPPRSRPTKKRAWFIAAVIAAAFTIAVLAFSMIRLQGSGADPVAESGGSTVVWPRNMPAGGVVYDRNLTPLPAEAAESGSSPEPRSINRDAGPADILLYVDYRCPACSMFESSNGQVLEDVVASGEASLEVRPLTFLDRVNEDDYYSSRAAAAQACVVDSQPELAWQTHSLLLSPEFIPNEASTGRSNEEIIEAFASLDTGVVEEVTSCIESEKFVPFAQAMNQWTFSQPVPDAVDPALEITGTPFAVVNGVPYTGAPDDSVSFEAFLEDQGIRLG